MAIYEDFADKYLTVGRRGRKNFMVICPFHDDNNPSMSFSVDDGLFLCFVCGAKGGITKLARQLGMIVKDNGFIPELDDPMGDLESLIRKLDEQESSVDNEGGDLPQIKPESYLRQFQNNPEEINSYWHEERGLNENTIRTFKLGYEFITQKPTIPVRDNEGKLLGVVKRSTIPGAYPKYHTPWGYQKTEYLYAFWPSMIQAKDSTGTRNHVVLVEGQIDAMKVWEAGYNVGAVMGSGLSLAQRKLLYRTGITDVTLFFDDDKAGFKMALQALGLLRKNMNVFAAQYMTGMPTDPGAMTTDQVREAISERVALTD